MKRELFFILSASLLLFSFRQQNDDAAAIKKLLEKEAATWRTGDVTAHAACWQIQPYSRILVSTTNGETFDVPPENMIKPSASMGNGGFAVISNYKVSIHGNNAWVSHDEESTSKDGKKTYSYEIRILEKINNEWKLVGQSIHIYVPKKTE